MEGRCGMYQKRHGIFRGFTLAELLIALLILRVIAAFTIPKVLLAQQNQSNNAAAKEAAGTISAAYQAYVLQNGTFPTGSIQSFTPYLNYLAVDTSTNIDLWQTDTNRTCGGVYTCLKLHNGGMLLYATGETFAGTATTNAVYFLFDPDGREMGGTTNGPGKSVLFILYANGRLGTYGTALPNTTFASGLVLANPEPTFDPPYFSW